MTVKAFHCLPGMGLAWPDAWGPMDTPSHTVANILPGAGRGVIVGPFDWTPSEVGHECVLVIVECANDEAVTQNLAAGSHVNHSDLVPFDNNIAQRNLAPTGAQGRDQAGLLRSATHTRSRGRCELRSRTRLPEGWRWRLDCADYRQIRLSAGPSNGGLGWS